MSTNESELRADVREVLDDPHALAQLVQEHGGELAPEDRRALLEQLQDPAARQELAEHVARMGRSESPEQRRRRRTRPARRRVAAAALVDVAPVLPPLPEHFHAEDEGVAWRLACRQCAKAWRLQKASQAPGHVATLLAHAAGCQGRAAAASTE